MENKLNNMNIRKTIREQIQLALNEEQEGSSYKSTLRKICDNSNEINSIINDEDDLPLWIQDKITIADHNMDAILDYLKTNEISKLYENWAIPMKLNKKIKVSDNLQYHLDNKLPIGDCAFRYGSEKYFDLISEVKDLYDNNLISLNENDEFIVSESDIKKVKINEEVVYLNCIYEDIESSNLQEAEYQGKDVEVGKPKRGGSKKFYVYVKNPKTGKIKKVSFGAKSGGGKLSVKLRDPKARKAFADRHNCEQKNDRTTPGYWSCRLPAYAKLLGLSSGGGKWW